MVHRLQTIQQEAKANHKLVLLNFTGSDWCGWCIKLQREVFSQPEFEDYASKTSSWWNSISHVENNSAT